MINGYKLVYSPTSDKRFRYKVKLTADEASCMGVIKEIGPICGRPFKNIGSDFEKAFYVYGSSDEIKPQIISALKKHATPPATVTEPSLPIPDEVTHVEEPVITGGEVLTPPIAEVAQEIPAPPPPKKQEDPLPAEEVLVIPPVQEKKEAPGVPPAPELKALQPEKRMSPRVAPEDVPQKDEWDHFDIPPLNGKYTFDNLYEGGFNRFLKQACEDIAKEFSPSYNPLFIWGGVGRGKTHLIQALGNFIKKHHDGKTVFYIQAQDLITMIQDAASSPTKKALLLKRFGSVDALLIDDIQFLEGEEIQKIFFLIFERAYQKDHQIVFTSDRSPKQLAGFADRLRSRFEWGLVNKLQKPDFGSRREILKMKISMEFTSLNLTEEMLDYIADKFKDNIRELEGVLKKLSIYHKLQGEEITMKSLKNIVAELLGEEIIKEPAAGTVSPGKLPVSASGDVSAEPPPPADFPPPPPEAQCPNCGSELAHIEMYDRWYCYSCQRYAPPDFGKGKFGISKKSHKKDKKVDFEKLAALEELRKLAAPKTAEPIPVMEEKDIEDKPTLSDKKETAPSEKKPASAVAPIKFTREIQCALFYPVRGDKSIELVTDAVRTTVTKHRLHIKFDFIVNQEYDIPKINYSSFLNVLNTAKVKVAIVVGPPKTSGVNEDEFYERLNGMFADGGLCFEYIAYKDIRQSYEYLNVVLDIANFGKQRLGYKMIKEEFNGEDNKKG